MPVGEGAAKQPMECRQGWGLQNVRSAMPNNSIVLQLP